MNSLKFGVRGILLCLITAAATALAADSSTDAVFTAIRNNNLAELHALVKDRAAANAKDDRGITALMYAAVAGSAESMKFLIGRGADVNAKNAFASTALMWSVTDLKKTQLLLDAGADVNAVSKAGRTALLIAAMGAQSAGVVRLLIAKGADVRAVDRAKLNALNAATIGNDTGTIRMLIAAGVDVNAPGGPMLTPLMNSASWGNTAAVKMLIAKGADVNAVSDPVLGVVKNGPIAIGKVTALLQSMPKAPAELVKALLDAGADVNAKDVRGMTALMLAIGTDHQNAEVIRLLLDRGADVKMKSLAGETASDWARKFPAAPAMKLLRAGDPAKPQVIAVSDTPADIGAAARKSIALIERNSGQFFVKGGCIACHSQDITDMAASIAKAHGMPVDETAAAERRKLIRAFYGAAGPSLIERIDDPGTPDQELYAMAALAAVGYPPDRMTDAILSNILAQQTRAGNWDMRSVARPPIEDGDIFRTALGLRMMAVFGPPGRSAEMRERIARARGWLASAQPLTTEDRNMQLLGLHWSGSGAKSLQPRAKAILAHQRDDGGWSQTAGLESDAYATGQSLFALIETGCVSRSEAAYRKGVKFLVSTQRHDGSWYVRSRSPKFQPYFESGFPYGPDQWISLMGTSWAAAALAEAVEPSLKKAAD